MWVFFKLILDKKNYYGFIVKNLIEILDIKVDIYINYMGMMNFYGNVIQVYIGIQFGNECFFVNYKKKFSFNFNIF